MIALCIAAGLAWAGVLFGVVADAISGWAIRTSADAGAAIECRLRHVCGLASCTCAADS
jgi:hypothetical protein